MGVGYKVSDDGVVTENYWERIREVGEQEGGKKRKPYRIELVGVVCDAYLAVIRGIRYSNPWQEPLLIFVFFRMALSGLSNNVWTILWMSLWKSNFFFSFWFTIEGQ